MNNIYIIQSVNKSSGLKASSIQTTDIRLQGKNVEKILVDFFDQLKREHDSIETVVTEKITTIVTNDFENELGEIREQISIINQTANKIDLLVKSTDGQGSISLTDSLFEAIAKNIKLTADRIDLNGYISNGKVINENGVEEIVEGNWFITNDGEMGVKNLGVEDTLSTNTLVVDTIESASYPKVLTGDLSVTIDSFTGNDSSSLEDGATFKTLTGFFNKLPKELNGRNITVKFNTDVTDNLYLAYFYGGRITFYMQSKTLFGYICVYNCTADIRFYGGTNASAPTVNAKVVPSTVRVYSENSVSACVLIQKSIAVSISDIDIYGNTSNVYLSGLHVADWGNLYFRRSTLFNCYNGVSGNNQAKLYATEVKGTATNYGWKTSSGSDFRLNDNVTLGGKKANYIKYSASTIITPNNATPTPPSPSDPGNDTGNPSTPGNQDADGGTNDGKVTTKVVTYKATSANTYRSTVYNNWKNDGTARQGNWGYGTCNGCFFFGSQFNNLKGKTIKKVEVKVKRQTGGYQASRPIRFKMHNHTSKPSGAPSYLTSWDDTLNLSVGSSGTLTITDTAVLSAIQNGKCKGFGIEYGSSKTNYLVLSGTCSVVITYEE